MDNLAGKVAFITGGASGIGFGMARAFLDAGLRVIIADHAAANLEDADRQLGACEGDYQLVSLDVTDRTAMGRAAEDAQRRFGKIHILCNNAGIGTSAPALQATYADWDRMLAVNLGGVINGVVTFLPYLRVHGERAHIVNTSSMAGLIPLPDPGVIYSTSKFAVRGLSESLRLALAGANIGVSLLCPGLTRTRILDAAEEQMRKGGADDLSAGFVKARQFAMDPRVVGQAVLQGIRHNEPYILPHAEFIDEIRELHEEIVRAFRTDLPVHPERAAFEHGRWHMIQALKNSMRGT